MNDLEEIAGILKAIASESRLEILNYISEGVSDPKEISQRLKRSRSTTQQHLEILLSEKIIQKINSASKNDKVAVIYELTNSSDLFLKDIEDVCIKFLHNRARW